MVGRLVAMCGPDLGDFSLAFYQESGRTAITWLLVLLRISAVAGHVTCDTYYYDPLRATGVRRRKLGIF